MMMRTCSRWSRSPLTQAGYVVVKAGDVPEALGVFDAESPDLAILDINLPSGKRFRRVPCDPAAVARADHDAHRAQRGGRPVQGARSLAPTTTSPSRSARARCSPA